MNPTPHTPRGPTTPTESAPGHRYSAALAAQIERRWQERWANADAYRAPNPGEPGFDPAQPKCFVLDMFPYPSGAGLHVGHPLGYIATDIFARYQRMNGKNVLHAMGFDAFGLPAEQYAIDTGTHPRVTTEKNIANFRRQLARLGLGHEKRRSVSTTDVGFYKWTQWIFLQLFKKGLAYESTAPINFCPSCKTGLANEEVFNGACERCGTKVERKALRQWVLKITAYADRLAKEGVAVEYRNYPDMVHGFITMGRVLDTANEALADCALKLKKAWGT